MSIQTKTPQSRIHHRIAGEDPMPIGVKRMKSPIKYSMDKLTRMKPAQLEIEIRNVNDVEWLRELNFYCMRRNRVALQEVVIERLNKLK